MQLKKGASVKGLKPEILLALVIAEHIYWDVSGHELVVTEVTGGKHMSNSLHYSGLAADLRTHDLTSAEESQIFKRLAAALGSEFDVVLESDHLHVEYQPE